ncbi:MAG TPA: autotransporter domain-containing protein [Acidocella sp.]|nr:autotransporter domain-containing protein [Acidocella sp.]
MKILPRHLASWMFAATCLTPVAAQAGSFYAFGDSLVDNGNIPRVYGVQFSFIEGSLAQYYDNGRFSNGPTWAEILPGLTGLSFSASNDVAVGGAFAGPLVINVPPIISGTFNNLSNLPSTSPPFAPATTTALPSFDEEVSNFAAAGGHFGAGDVAGVWVGANNYFVAAQQISASPSSANAIVQAAVAQDVGQIGAGVSGLISLGAKTLIVQNLPPLGATPTFNGATDQLNGTTYLVNQISSLHNSELSLAMEALHSSTGANIIVVNETQLFNEVLANPSAFGITNTTTACVTVTSCLTGSTATQNTYLFWDGVHPTAGIHQFIAEYAAADLNALRALTAPAQIAADGQAAFSGQLSARMSDLQAGASGFALNLPDHNMVAELGANDAAPEAQVGKLSGFISGGYSYGNRNASAVTSGFNYNIDSFTLGIDDHVAPGIALGAAFGYGDETGTVQYGSKIKSNAYQFGAYATFYQPNFYLNLKFAFGVDSYNNTRPAVLGSNITAKPSGYTYDFGMGTGYVMHRGRYAFGPIAGIDVANAHLGAYTESGDAALTQSVNAQDYSRVIADVGVAASTSLNINGITLNPHISATADELLSGNGGNFNSVFTDQPGVTLTSTYPNPTHFWAEIQGGVTADLTHRLSLSADFGTTVAKTDGEDHQISANLRYSF